MKLLLCLMSLCHDYQNQIILKKNIHYGSHENPVGSVWAPCFSVCQSFITDPLLMFWALYSHYSIKCYVERVTAAQGLKL